MGIEHIRSVHPMFSLFDITFERPINYIKTTDDQVTRVVWLRQFNNNISDCDGKETNKIT